MKKWLLLLLALVFSFAPVYAASYDDDEDEEEEEAPVKKKAAPKAAQKAKKSGEGGPSRLGLAVSFAGSENVISFVYDMGSGMEIGLGIGLDRTSETRTIPKDTTITKQRWSIVPSMQYQLGKGLLDYGLGVWISASGLNYITEPAEAEGDVMDISLCPSFYAGTELVKNVYLRLNAGMRVDKLGDIPAGDKNYSEGRMNIGLNTSASLTFYFK